MPRNYAREYRTYQGKPAQIKRRALRNKARRQAVKKYGKAKLRGKDVNHLSPGNLAKSKTNIVSASRNRGFRRNSKGKNLGLPSAHKLKR